MKIFCERRYSQKSLTATSPIQLELLESSPVFFLTRGKSRVFKEKIPDSSQSMTNLRGIRNTA